MQRAKKPTLEQLVLLVLVREQTATIPELVDRFDKTYELMSRVMRGLRTAELTEVTATRPHTDRHPACHVFSPTKGAIGALKIPYETPLPPRFNAPVLVSPIAAPAAVVAAAPAAEDARPPRDGKRALKAERAAAVPAPDDELDAPPPTAARPRTRSNSGSGVIAGWITIGRGYKWGSG